MSVDQLSFGDACLSWYNQPSGVAAFELDARRDARLGVVRLAALHMVSLHLSLILILFETA